MALQIGLRRFFSKSIHFSRILVVESGNRHLAEGFLKSLADNHPYSEIDLVTCYAGTPQHFQERGTVYRVSDYPDSPSRKRLYAELASKTYNIITIICSTEPIMTKWKWMLAARVPAKVLVLNENGDFFMVDRGNIGIIFHFMLFRAGLTGAFAVRTIGRLVLFPFTLLYLILYAASVHLRRRIRTL